MEFWAFFIVYLCFQWGASTMAFPQNESFICGRQFNLSPRIIGGTESKLGLWPWQIRLMVFSPENQTYYSVCGGALVTKNYGLTAAHCVYDFKKEDLFLMFGEHNFSELDNGITRKVVKINIFSKFDPENMTYDIAILKFDTPVKFQENIIPICLPLNPREQYAGKKAVITGWGLIAEDGPPSDTLRHVVLPVLRNDDCIWSFQKAGVAMQIRKHFICAGINDGRGDSCEGDSGGPLAYYHPKERRYILIGLLSWGVGCAQPLQPGVYTRITSFLSWIMKGVKLIH